MSRSGIYSRVSSIPEDDLKTVRYIKEIIKDHSDEDIYAMLEECSMDPAETIHRLSHLDIIHTFHVVKSKRDKRKEKINKVPEEPRRRSGNQGRGSRSSRGSGSSQFVSQDAGGGRNSAVRKENGPVESREKGLHHSPFLKSRDVDGKINKLGTKSSSILVNGPVEMLDDIPATGYGKKMLNVTNVTKDNADIGAEKQKMLPQPNAPVDHAPSASDLILVPSHDSHLLTPVGSIEHEVHMQCIAEPATCVSANQLNQSDDRTSDPDIQQNDIAMISQLPSYQGNENVLVGPSSNYGPKAGKSGQLQTSIASEPVILSVENSTSSGPNASIGEEEHSKLEKLKFSTGQHVIIPNHIQVPASVKNVLSFGSFGASSDVEVNDINNSESSKSSDASADPLVDETAEEPTPRQGAPSTAQEGNSHDFPQTPSDVPEKASVMESNIPSAALQQYDQLKTMLPSVGPPYPNVPPGYNFFMPTMLGNPFVQLEGLDAQARLSNSLGGNSQTSVTAPTPPPTQSAGVGQSTVFPQHVPLIRQPYPPNFYPYGHFFPPFYVQPTPHQFFGQGGFLPVPQMPTANMYLTPPAAVAGMKVTPAPYKPGTNAGNQAPLGIPSGFGIYGSSQVGYSPSAAVTSGNPNTNEDVSPSLKENNICVGNQGEVSAWMPIAGRDVSTPPLNSFFNPPQSVHGTFTVYPPVQPAATSAAADHHPLMQQSQSMAESVEPVGPPSNAYQQQSQHQQMNWNSNF